MVDTISAPDPTTVVFKLKFATLTFLPALADPFAYIYKQDILDKDPNWYQKNIMGSGPFKFVGYELGQSIKGERNPDYYHKGQPYLDGFVGIYRRQAGGAHRGDPRRSRDDRIPWPAALGDRSAQEGARRQGHHPDRATGTAAT